MSIKSKVHKSAVVVIPPLAVWDQIQAIRKVHDKSYERWMPHINMLYPFAPDTEFEALKPKAIEALSSIQPFTIDFKEFQYFNHGKSNTLWLNPQEGSESSKTLQEIESKLVEAFPICRDLVDRGDNGFAPHLTVGQFSRQQVEKSKSQFQSSWKPFQFKVECLYFISRTDTDPFEVKFVIPLNGQSPQSIRNDFEEKPIVSQNVAGQTQFFVANLPHSLSEAELKGVFAPHCTVTRVKIVMDPKTKKSKGFGFVTCSNCDASSVISATNRTNVQGREISVKPAK